MFSGPPTVDSGLCTMCKLEVGDEIHIDGITGKYITEAV
jgi:hypothetical protein